MASKKKLTTVMVAIAANCSNTFEQVELQVDRKTGKIVKVNDPKYHLLIGQELVWPEEVPQNPEDHDFRPGIQLHLHFTVKVKGYIQS